MRRATHMTILFVAILAANADSAKAVVIFDDHFDDGSFTGYSLFFNNSDAASAVESGTVVEIGGSEGGQGNRIAAYETTSQFDFATPSSVTLKYLIDAFNPANSVEMRARFGYIGPPGGTLTAATVGMQGYLDSTGQIGLAFGDGTAADIVIALNTAIPGWSGGSNPPIEVTVNLDAVGWELIFSSDTGSPFSDTWANGTNVTSFAETLDAGMSSLFIGVDLEGNTTGTSTVAYDRLTMEAAVSAAATPEPSTFALAVLGLLSLGLLARRRKRVES